MSDELVLERHIQTVAGYAAEYRRIHIRSWNADELLGDWWHALRFWFGHCFYQGRRDSLSSRFQASAEQVLVDQLGKDKTAALAALAQEGIVGHRRLDGVLQAAGLPKRMDRLMVLSSLDLITRLPGHNLVRYSLGEIRNNALLRLYQQLDALPSVGDKIISFYLRDLYFLFDIQACFSEQDYVLMQPIDTWVRQISKNIGLLTFDGSEYMMKRTIVEACLHAQVDPNEYNVGAWWVGTHHVDLS